MSAIAQQGSTHILGAIMVALRAKFLRVKRLTHQMRLRLSTSCLKGGPEASKEC